MSCGLFRSYLAEISYKFFLLQIKKFKKERVNQFTSLVKIFQTDLLEQSSNYLHQTCK